MNKSSTKKNKDPGPSSSTEPLLMTQSQSFDMTPIPSSANSYTNNFRNGDHYNKKITNDSDFTQPKAVEDYTNIGQARSPHKQKMPVFSKEKLVSMNPVLDSNVKEVPFHSGSIEESTNTEKCPDLPSGAKFPGAHIYLTPTDPPPYPHSNMLVSSTSDPLSNSTNIESNFGNADIGKTRHQPIQSCDSGLGDEQSEQGPGTLPNLYGPPKSPLPKPPQEPTHQEQHYEDVDRYQPAQESAEPRTVSTPTTPLETQSHAYTPFCEGQNSVCKSKKSRNCQCCCVVVTLSIILVISLAALAVSIYVLVINGKVLNAMRAEIESLKEENERMKTTAVTDSSNETLYLQQGAPEWQNLTIALQNLESKLEIQIANISRTPGLEGPQGPQGPPGIANFTGCVNKSISSTTVTTGDSTTTHTDYMPPAEDLELYYPHFAYCDAGNGTGRLDSIKGPRYRCRCTDIPVQGKVYCSIHVWMCPKA